MSCCLPPESSLNSSIAQLSSLEQEVEALVVARGWRDDLCRRWVYMLRRAAGPYQNDLLKFMEFFKGCLIENIECGA